MRIAFYAPLKPPTHPTPSGDRLVARLLMAALRRAGHTVELASAFRSLETLGDPRRQERLERVGSRLADRFLRHSGSGAPRPDLWFTYHPYHRAPDWLGPKVSQSLRIPYVVAEASIAGKQQGGPWGRGHKATIAALAQAALIIALNPADAEGIRSAVSAPERLCMLEPFIDRAKYARAVHVRVQSRTKLVRGHGLNPAWPWLVAVGMMRERAKLASYQLLGQALKRLLALDWNLLVIGDGPERAAVEKALAPLGDRVRWAGLIEAEDMPAHLSACDVLVWPAIDEAYGMALLEAQASGLPVVAGASGGVPFLVEDGVTGRLSAPGSVASFADALAPLLTDHALRSRMSKAARRKIAADHDIDGASRRLNALIEHLPGVPGRR